MNRLANGLFQKLFSEVMQEAKKPEQKAALAILFSELNFSRTSMLCRTFKYR